MADLASVVGVKPGVSTRPAVAVLPARVALGVRWCAEYLFGSRPAGDHGASIMIMKRWRV